MSTIVYAVSIFEDNFGPEWQYLEKLFLSKDKAIEFCRTEERSNLYESNIERSIYTHKEKNKLPIREIDTDIDFENRTIKWSWIIEEKQLID